MKANRSACRSLNMLCMDLHATSDCAAILGIATPSEGTALTGLTPIVSAGQHPRFLCEVLIS